MAEQVQAVLDRMVSPLKDLLDKGIFDETEIKSIVARRRESEYLLRRRQARRSDYATYIEAEKNLEKLRVLRNKKVVARRIAEEREMNQNTKKIPEKRKPGRSIGDASIVQHIHLLYVRAKRKWKQDLSWHIQHAEFAKESQSHSMLSKIYAEALQFHPRNSSLWIEAASHEYFGCVSNESDAGMSGGGSIKNARVLLQRGLRINPDSRELWLQSFCLELHYMQKLRGRRELLQLDLKKPSPGVEDSFNNDDDETVEEFYHDAKLPRIIYKNATKSICSDVRFRLQFIDQCRLFPETKKIIDEIMASIEDDFENIEEAWIARAKFSLDNKTKVPGGFLMSPWDSQMSKKRKYRELAEPEQNDALDILEEATDTVCTPKMFRESISFVKSYIGQLSDKNSETNLSNIRKAQITVATTFLKSIVKKAEANNIMSSDPELAVEFADILVATGSTSDALRIMKNATDRRKDCCACPQIWLKRAEITARISPYLTSSCKVLRKSLQEVPLHNEGYCDLLSKLFLNLLLLSTTIESSVMEKEVASIYDKILLCFCNQADSRRTTAYTIPSLSLSYLQLASSRQNLQLMREISTKLLNSSNYLNHSNITESELFDMKVLLKHCIAHEKVALNFGGSRKSRQKLTHLCEAAFDFFMKNDRPEIADSFMAIKDKN